MPVRWARVHFQELPSPCFREGTPRIRAPHSAWQLRTKLVVPCMSPARGWAEGITPTPRAVPSEPQWLCGQLSLSSAARVTSDPELTAVCGVTVIHVKVTPR